MVSSSILVFYFSAAAASLSLAGSDAPSQDLARSDAFVEQHLSHWLELYKELHARPELSLCEKETAQRLATAWRRSGLTVTEGVGGTGIVGVLGTGKPPRLMLRTDMDALPIVEETGLPYASHVRAPLEGKEVGVMHACGHDLHMTIVTGALQTLSALRDSWHGTLLVVGQPAEERGMGSAAMLADGLFERFPRPQAALALHVDAMMPAGHLGTTFGWAMANADAVDIAVFGTGGHGAAPHETRDPIVLAARIVLALQTIVSRELPPNDAVVVTVGSIQGGSKHNLIPDRVDLQLTVRCYAPETRAHILQSIERICRGEAIAAGVDRMPEVKVRDEFTPALYNDPELGQRLVSVFTEIFGKDRLHEREPEMVAEDFSRYGLVEPRIPIFMFRLGTAPQALYERSLQPGGAPLPPLHSSRYSPDPEPSIRAGVRAFVAAALDRLR
ncbi:MAG: amidohydrolase [Planctomycetota bacterium]